MSLLIVAAFPVDSILLAIYAVSASYTSRGIDDGATIRGSHHGDLSDR
jgi:hypothetical protein